MSVRLDRVTVVAAFGAFGVFWGAWGAALPQIQHSARVDSGTLGLDLLLIGVGAICSMRLTGNLVDRLGPLVLPGSMVAMAVTGVLPALTRSGLTLGLALFMVGAASGAYDVAINTAGARSEARTGGPIMNVAHAGFSVGVVATSLSVGVALDRGATPLAVFAGCGLATIAVAVALTALRHSTAWGQGAPTAGPADASGKVAVPADMGVSGGIPRISRPLLILGGICGLAYFVEGAWQSWGALHIERTFRASPALGATAPAAFALAAACGRLLGQRITRLATPRTMLQCGAVIAAGGTILAAVAPTSSIALIGVAVAGLGTSTCAPTVFSLTGQVAAPANRGAAMGTVTTLAYLGFVLGPALVGVFTSAIGLRSALALVGLAAVALGLLGRKAPVLVKHTESPPQLRPTS